MLSTATRILCFFARVEQALISTMFINGLVGVSSQRSFVLLLISGSTLLVLVRSVKWNLIPYFSKNMLEHPVWSAIQVITGYHFISRIQQLDDSISSAHPGRKTNCIVSSLSLTLIVSYWARNYYNTILNYYSKRYQLSINLSH